VLKKIIKLNKMNKHLLITFFLACTITVYAQDLDLKTFNQNRADFSKKAMYILGGWAVGNIALSGLRIGNTDLSRPLGGGSAKSFHQMNLGWNAVNATIATFGYLAAIRENPASYDLFTSINEHHKVDKLFLFNAGLDVGYMAAGAWMLEKSKNDTKNPQRWKGFGQAIALNGAFLFAFDLSAYLIHSSKITQLQPLLSIGLLTERGGEMGLSWRF
jgi:hypothetical protein